jgi:hypothetical protein
MKRLLFLFALTTMLVSCGDTVVEKYTTEDYHIQTINLTARAQDWIINSAPNIDIPLYYACTFAMPEINNLVFEQGLVQAYIVFDGVQQVLPFVQHNKNADGVMWTRTIDYRYAVGDLTIFVTNSDFIVDPPEAMNFRAVIMW